LAIFVSFSIPAGLVIPDQIEIFLNFRFIGQKTA